jgi:hypothetical protein
MQKQNILFHINCVHYLVMQAHSFSLWFYKLLIQSIDTQCIQTFKSLSIASSMFVEYLTGRHRQPSDRLGSEFRPITGLSFPLTRLAAIRYVPSPPVGIITSAQSILPCVYSDLCTTFHITLSTEKYSLPNNTFQSSLAVKQIQAVLSRTQILLFYCTFSSHTHLLTLYCCFYFTFIENVTKTVADFSKIHYHTELFQHHIVSGASYISFTKSYVCCHVIMTAENWIMKFGWPPVTQCSYQL